MNKSFIFFVLSVGFTLLGINVHYQKREQTAVKEWIAEQELKKAQATIEADSK